MDASACCTRTRTTAASGTTTSATSAGWRSTTPALRSTSFNTHWEHKQVAEAAAAWTENEIADLAAKVDQLKASMSQVIIGQKDVIELLVTCLLGGGHALVE